VVLDQVVELDEVDLIDTQSLEVLRKIWSLLRT